MTISQSLVLYSSSISTTLSTEPRVTSLIRSSYFARHTGAAIAIELLYRIIFDIIQRLLTSFQHIASNCIDHCSWVERKMQERRERLASPIDRLEIFDEVGKLAVQNGFIACPMTGFDMQRGGQQPPQWAKVVLEGIEEGRMEEKDF